MEYILGHHYGVSERPVLDKEQVTKLSKQIMSMTSADTVVVQVAHAARATSVIANNEVRSNDDGDEMEISVFTKFGQAASISVSTNQITEGALRAIVGKCEELARNQINYHVPTPESPQEPDSYIPVSLWHATTIEGMVGGREAVIPELIEGVAKHGLNASGFVGLIARTKAVLTKEGIYAFGEETDSEVTVTARTSDYKTSGWAGRAARDWSTIDYGKIADEASQIALRSQGARALEPGHRTAILSPAAVVQMARYFAQEMDAYTTDNGGTGFSKSHGGNKLGQQMFDRRLQMSSDPMDPEGGYISFFSVGYATPKMTWVKNGVLKNLAYDPSYGVERGKPYAENPYSLRISADVNTTLSSIEDMISRCQDGIYVNRLSDVSMINMKTGMMTGVTNNGCFFVKNGKIDRPVKNFRILDSPFFFFNNIEAIGKSIRAAYGYTPPGKYEYSWDRTFAWPRRPMIVPALMVRDFNFSSLGDAV